MRILSVGLLACMAAFAHSQAADGLFTRAGRPHLAPPAALWDRVHDSLGRTGKPFGYTFEEMLGFPPFEYRLRSVENLFRDVLQPAEYGALMGNNLLDKHKEPAQELYMLWSQLDARAGREWAAPKGDDWGVNWIKSGATPAQALRAALDRPNSPTDVIFSGRFTQAESQVLANLGDGLVRLVARLTIAAHLADPYFKAAGSPEMLADALRGHSGRPYTRQEAYDLLVSPYLGDVNDDTIIVAERAAYQYLRDWDKNYAAFGSALFLRHFDAAMTEYSEWAKAHNPGDLTQPLVLHSALGPIIVGTKGNDKFDRPAAIIVDPAGDDTYTDLIASPASYARPLSVVVDFGGNDIYDGTAIDGNVGCGLFGLGLLVDLTGNDTYKVKNGGIGFGLYGTGAVIDNEGDDTYEVGKGWGQGAAYAGVGFLLDRKGNDKYRSICMSMGFGGTMGVGALVDVEGNDSYFTADTGNESKVWGKTVSMSLGCGYGRRCDSGDGQNQGGGVGIVVEGAGDDTYHTSVFSLGSGYWWGAGIFEERGGNDTYRCTQYSIGSGAHFAVGSFVDMNGNDRYNDRPDAQERWGGIARDGCLAVCIDAAGDDVWGNLTGGHADLNSYALFWDIKGNDVHKRIQPYDPKQDGNRPFGSATTYPPMLNFRDRLLSGGIFLDTGGKDVYPDGMGPKENTSWQFQKGPISWSTGIDKG
ncbi:MAG TPA: hypothetical protein PKA27_14895 [Fimbriimonadaceae bacterium]|nr:hypothetical protein [Fimbriimonadaceae bacterium]